MCEIQRCFDGDCDGAWDCVEPAVVEVSFLVSGGFYGRLRVKKQKKCVRCFLNWCRNRKRKGLPLPELVKSEERYWRSVLDRASS